MLNYRWLYRYLSIDSNTLLNVGRLNGIESMQLHTNLQNPETWVKAARASASNCINSIQFKTYYKLLSLQNNFFFCCKCCVI